MLKYTKAHPFDFSIFQHFVSTTRLLQVPISYLKFVDKLLLCNCKGEQIDFFEASNNRRLRNIRAL